LFGQRLLKRLMANNDNPEVGVAAVCAHEFGHILQYKHKLDKKLRDGQPTVKRVELQADFFAGYFAGARKRERPAFPAAVFAMTQYNMGDDMIHNPSHHGTPDERAAAIVRGFETAFKLKRSLAEAIQISMEYVATI
jgi:predicted metalloprotease